jgi:hypothetical protein
MPLQLIQKAMNRWSVPMQKILKGLKTRTYDGLKKHGKKWIDELPCTL